MVEETKVDVMQVIEDSPNLTLLTQASNATIMVTTAEGNTAIQAWGAYADFVMYLKPTALLNVSEAWLGVDDHYHIAITVSLVE